MVNSNSIIEFYRKSIVSGIVTDCVYNSTNDVGEKVKVRVWPTWKTKTHVKPIGMTAFRHLCFGA